MDTTANMSVIYNGEGSVNKIDDTYNSNNRIGIRIYENKDSIYGLTSTKRVYQTFYYLLTMASQYIFGE